MSGRRLLPVCRQTTQNPVRHFQERRLLPVYWQLCGNPTSRPLSSQFTSQRPSPRLARRIIPIGGPGYTAIRHVPRQHNPMNQARTLSEVAPNRVRLNVSGPLPSVTRILRGNGKEMMLPLQTLDLAQRLVAHESAAGKTAEPTKFAASRICETLRQPVCALAGVAGFRSLLSRALTLAKAEAPSLSAVQVAADGSLQGLDELDTQIDQDQAREVGAILIAQLIGLLLFYIGEGVTLRLVISEVLPHLGFLPTSGMPVGFEAILNEVDQLQSVSARLDGLAEQNPPVTEALMTIADSVRKTATVLAVVAAVKSPKPN